MYLQCPARTCYMSCNLRLKQKKTFPNPNFFAYAIFDRIEKYKKIVFGPDLLLFRANNIQYKNKQRYKLYKLYKTNKDYETKKENTIQ